MLLDQGGLDRPLEGHGLTVGIMFGVRDPNASKVLTLLEGMNGGSAGTVSEACKFGDVILLAVPGAAVSQIAVANSALLGGKIIIDATNQNSTEGMNNIALLMRLLPDASLYRAFNSLGWEVLATPKFGEEKADLFFCGAEENESAVSCLIEDASLRPIYLGGVAKVSQVDEMTRLWFTLVYERGYDRHTAFRVLT